MRGSRENQKLYTNHVASRDHGTDGKNNPAQWGGLDGKKNSGHQERCFLLDSLYGTNRDLGGGARHNNALRSAGRARFKWS